MSGICRICLDEVRGGGEYHQRCLSELFGKRKVPAIDIELGKMHTAALAMVGHTSISGAQKKISVHLSADRATLKVAVSEGHYILKPQTEVYPNLPENEHVTTRLAQLVDIGVGKYGLIPLQDGSLAYIVRRFDRTAEGRKLRQEDFCQLAEKSPKEKYDGTAELCVKLLRKYASEPPIEILKFFRLLIFSWWSGNGDMHLKNFSLQAGPDGLQRLTPAYDLVCTRLVIADDPLALPACGKKENFDRADWLRFAEYCHLPTKTAGRVLDTQANALDEALVLLNRSFLPTTMKQTYAKLVQERTAALA